MPLFLNVNNQSYSCSTNRFPTPSPGLKNASDTYTLSISSGKDGFNESARMPRLLTSELFLIAFVISLWLISIIVCLKRYSLFICFHKRDVPFYNSSLINVSTKLSTEKYSSCPQSPSSHQHLNESNLNKEECDMCPKSPSANALLNKTITQSAKYNYDQRMCKKCSRIRPKDCFKSLSNGHFNFSSNKSIHKNFSFYSNRTQCFGQCGKMDCYCSHGIICPIQKNSSSMLNRVSLRTNAKESLVSRRDVIKNKHFNLMSLDENALYKLNRISHLNSTIHESSVDVPEIELKEARNDKKLSILASGTPHANFISLRSGSDSVNSWIRPGRSCDNSDCNDIDSSSSLQQSQFLKLPSLNTVLPTSQRPINPISSLRRHMFANSKRCAQTTFGMDSVANDCSVDFLNSMSINSNNQSAIPAIVDEQNFEPDGQETSVQVLNECNDPNLLNPSWIPMIVRRTLLEMHERAVLSKSDSNIKYKYRSSNHLLHSTGKKLKSNRKKKSLSLQNSQDKSTFYSTSPSNNRSTKSNYLNSFYEELRNRFFQPGEVRSVGNEKIVQSLLTDGPRDKIKKSGSNSNTMSTDVSTVILKLDSKLNSLDMQNPVVHYDKCSDLKLDEENVIKKVNNLDNL
ncbi:hypothetical protein BpHYR1_030260 [Brachionus plicatilis]|uniref:Uncharacterized protein n=1 Tax=Brachionus plicatilis TaxID=10195 RepID=A0A3M7RUY1_BRAPC|nr:hypothetical protein BpHYR1_030260 [Brachionus plicatilis]